MIMPKIRLFLAIASFAFLGSAAFAQNAGDTDRCAAVRAAMRQDGADSTAVISCDNDELLTCFRKGGKAMMLVDDPEAEVWGVSETGAKDDGWIAVFNRSDKQEYIFVVTHDELGLQTCPGNYALLDVWGDDQLRMGQEVPVKPGGVLLIRYRSLD